MPPRLFKPLLTLAFLRLVGAQGFDWNSVEPKSTSHSYFIHNHAISFSQARIYLGWIVTHDFSVLAFRFASILYHVRFNNADEMSRSHSTILIRIMDRL